MVHGSSVCTARLPWATSHEPLIIDWLMNYCFLYRSQIWTPDDEHSMDAMGSQAPWRPSCSSPSWLSSLRSVRLPVEFSSMSLEMHVDLTSMPVHTWYFIHKEILENHKIQWKSSEDKEPMSEIMKIIENVSKSMWYPENPQSTRSQSGIAQIFL